MNAKRNCRVCTDSDVLNYFSSKKASLEYLGELEMHSPDVAADAYIERYNVDACAWYRIKNVCK